MKAFQVGVEIRTDPFVRFVHEGRGNHVIRRGPVARHGDVPYDGDPQECLHVGVMGVWFQRIPEEDDEIDEPFRDLGPNLLITPQRAALQLDDRRFQGFLDPWCAS